MIAYDLFLILLSPWHYIPTRLSHVQSKTRVTFPPKIRVFIRTILSFLRYNTTTLMKDSPAPSRLEQGAALHDKQLKGIFMCSIFKIVLLFTITATSVTFILNYLSLATFF